MYYIKGKYTNALMTLDNFEEALVNQVYTMINHVAFDKPIAIMIDGHAGKGSCVGFTMPLSNKIVPSTIGVDGSCGLTSVNFGKITLPNLEELEKEIREYVPTGMRVRENNKRNGKLPDFSFEKQFPWKKANDLLKSFSVAYNKKFNTSYTIPEFDYNWFIKTCKRVNMDAKRAEMSISSMGSGNHFQSIDKSDKTNEIWFTVHTGSRNFGKCVCVYHEELAKKELENKRSVILRDKIEEIKKTTEDKTKIQSLIVLTKKELGLASDVSLSGMEYLEGQNAFNYFIDMIFINTYASFNRQCIVETVCEILNKKPIETIETVHNYIDFRDFIIRKGAIRSYIGEKMVIPLNMKDGILICEGKTNSDWNFSAPHGAGRKMSRSQSRKVIDFEKYKEQMIGICTTSVCESTIDEAPDNYKDSKMIEEMIEPTAIIIDRLRPILNIKAKSS